LDWIRWNIGYTGNDGVAALAATVGFAVFIAMSRSFFRLAHSRTLPEILCMVTSPAFCRG
jgi:hypothetical protein